MHERTRLCSFLLAGLLACGCGGTKGRPAAAPAVPPGQGSTVIQVVASGLQHQQGRFRMALFAAAEGFPEHAEKSLHWGYAAMQGSQGSMYFEPVAAGVYAVAVFHDEDGDGKMDKDWLGRPKEGWGVSRDAEGTFGPPSFEDAAFATAGDTMTVRVRMRY